MPESTASGPSAHPLRYWICSTQRSGSTLLCDLLTQTGEHGEPDEYLDIRKAVYRELYEAGGGTRDAYLPWLFAPMLLAWRVSCGPLAAVSRA